MSARQLLAAALLISLAAAAANADETPAHIFHIGIVSGTPRSHPANVAFEDRLRELGYVEGRNLTIDFVQGDDLDRLAVAVGEFARRGIDVIVVGAETALKAASSGTAAHSTPVVFRAVDLDPLAKGYIASLAHPGGNLTGVAFQQPELIAKRLDLLTQAVPHIARIVLLYEVSGESQKEAATRAASVLGIPFEAIDLHSPPYDDDFGVQSARGCRRVCVAASPAGDRQLAQMGRKRISDVLWAKYIRHVPYLGRLRRQDPEGRRPTYRSSSRRSSS